MSRIQFSLKDLLAVTLLIGTGIGILGYLFAPTEGHPHAPLSGWQFVLWFVSGAMIGAGLFLPFRRPITGASIGLIVQIVAWLSMGVIWT